MIHTYRLTVIHGGRESSRLIYAYSLADADAMARAALRRGGYSFAAVERVR